MTVSLSRPAAAPPLDHVRAPRPVNFAQSETVPETKLHLTVRTALYQLLVLHFAERACVGSDQFLYLDASDPTACLAPDAFVALGRPDDMFRTWKVWERGAPDVAVEVLSDADGGVRAWNEKLERYHRSGVSELVGFDPERRALRVWDRVEGDLLERVVEGPTTPCRPLGYHWFIQGAGDATRLRDERDRPIAAGTAVSWRR